MSRTIRGPLMLALTWIALAVAPAPAQETKATKVTTAEGITEYKLPNGARFLLFPDPSSSTVTVNMVVLVGSRHEGYGESGMAHLLEHMCFKGSKLFPDKNDIDKALQEHGAANANATTSLDRTNYYETMPASDKNLQFGIMLSADILQTAFIRKADLDKEMTVVRSEFEQGENNPVYVLNQRMTGVAFEWHNYGKSVIGNKADIERVPIENLQAFYKKYYQPDNIVLVIAGKFNEENAIAYVEKYFGPLKKPSRVLQDTYTEEPAQDGERTVTLRRVGNVPFVGVMYHMPATAHADAAALDVLTTILATRPTGRLYKALVEKKKATAVSAGIGGYTHDPYLVEVFAQVADGVKAEEVRDSITDLLEKLGDSKVTEVEVARAKRKAKVDFEQQLAKSDQFALDLCEWIGAGDWRLAFIHRDRVDQVTPKDVEEAARKYFKASNRTVGIYVPTAKPDRTPVPDVPDIAKMVHNYKGSAALAAGEHFDPTPENLEKRTKRLTLPGGQKAALLSKKTRGEMVVGQISLHYGNEQSLLGKTTASSFVGPLMMRGTTKYTYEQLQDELDVLGATVSIGGSAGELTVSLECKRDKLIGTLNLIQEMLRNPIFPKEEMGIIKRSARQGLEKGLTDPATLARNALQRKLNPFPKDSIHYIPTLAESIERLDHVTRTDVVEIYNEQLGAAVGEVAFVGDFDEQETLKHVEAMLKDWKSKTKYERIPTVVKLDVAGGKEKIETPDKANANYIAGFYLAMDDSDPDYAALVLANYILGQSGFNSRIMERLRQDEGLSYGAGSRFNASAQDKAASFMLSAICNPENMDKLDKVMNEVLKKYAKEGITEQKELDLGIQGLLQERKVARADDGSVLGSLIGQTYLGRTYERTIEFEKQLAAMTMERINAAIRRHFQPQRFYMVEAGDFAKKN
jgi:zinc protease